MPISFWPGAGVNHFLFLFFTITISQSPIRTKIKSLIMKFGRGGALSQFTPLPTSAPISLSIPDKIQSRRVGATEPRQSHRTTDTHTHTHTCKHTVYCGGSQFLNSRWGKTAAQDLQRKKTTFRLKKEKKRRTLKHS